MPILKQLSVALTMTVLLALPLGVMGCAEQADAPTAPAETGVDDGAGADTDLEPELGQPEGETNL